MKTTKEMTPPQTVENFKTKEMFVAAFLLCKGSVRYLGLERIDARSYYFVFSPHDKCQKLATDFLSGNGLVRARAYADAVRRAKELVFGVEGMKSKTDNTLLVTNGQ